MSIRRIANSIVLGMIGTVGLVSAATPEAVPAPRLRIGVVKTFFRDLKPQFFDAMAMSFDTVVAQQTGLKANLVAIDSAEKLCQQLTDGTTHFGVFHGVEFGWMKQKQSDLEPLMLNIINPDALQAYLVVSKESSIQSFAECRGSRLAIPVGTREDSRLFLARQCRLYRSNTDKYFGATTVPKSVEDALDDVVDNVAQVALVDRAGLKMFERRKPARYARIRIVLQSEPFPPSVMAYRRGSIDERTLKAFTQGMRTAHNTMLGAHLMSLMKIRRFETVPDDYEKRVTETVHVYPASD